MRMRAFIIGYSMALVMFLLSQHRTVSAEAPAFRRTVDLTRLTLILDTTTLGTTTLNAAQSVTRQATRIEAPGRIVPGLWTVDQIPVQRLRAPLVVLNVTQLVAANPNYQIRVEDIAAWEVEHGDIPFGAVVIARTGWQPETSRGRSPRFSTDAVQFLVEGRAVVGLGTDGPSVEEHRGSANAGHTFAARHSVYQLDNVNLNSVPDSGGGVFISPSGVSGSLQSGTRVLAMVM